MPQPSFKYHLLAELITVLKANGFAIGTGLHLKTQELLSRLPDDIDTENLALHLCPLFAQSPKQQDIFHDAFQNALQNTEAYYKAIAPQPISLEAQQEERKWQWLFALLGLALLIPPMIFFFLSIFTPSSSQQIKIPFVVNGGTQKIACLSDTLELKGYPSIETSKLIYQKSPSLGTVSIDTPYCITYKADSISGQDSLIIELMLTDQTKLNAIFLPIIKGTINENDIEEAPLAKRRSEPQKALPVHFSFTTKIPPYDHDILKYHVIAPPKWKIFVAKNFWWLKWIGFALFTALLTAIWMYRASKRQKLIAASQRIDRPPYVHSIKLEGIEQIGLGQDFNLLLNKIRQRTTDEARLLNIPGSVDATIHKAGMATFVYKQQTKPPEYLLLIDQQHTQNHRARFFDYIFKTFRSSDVLIERFFFDGDPRVCYNTAFPKGIPLQALQHKYRDSRLILLSNGNALLNKFSGKPVEWHDLLLNWKTRALFTPKATNDWGKRERRLGKILTVLPISMQSLQFWLEQLENAEDAVFSHWPNVVQDAPKSSITIDGPLISSLSKHYDEQMLRWIASCAIYPSLHWDLTLFLGQQLSKPSSPLLESQKILAITQLPWFVEGKIPESSRMLLVDWMEVNHPQQLRQLRQKLVEVLNTVPPPNDSSAFEEYSMNLALNDWLSTDNKPHKRQLAKQISMLANQGEEIDITVLKKLEAPQTSLDFVLPENLKAQLYPQGLPALGSHKTWKDLFRMTAFLWLPLFILTACWPWPPVQVPQCSEAIAAAITISKENKGREVYQLCISDAIGVFQLWEKQISIQLQKGGAIPEIVYGLIEQEQRSTIDINYTISNDDVKLRALLEPSAFEIEGGLLESRPESILFTLYQLGMDSLNVFMPKFQQNIAVELFNIGVAYSHQYERDTSNNALLDSACVYFNLAIQTSADVFSAEEQIQINQWCNPEGSAQISSLTLNNCYAISIPSTITIRSRPLTASEKQQLNEQSVNSSAWNRLPVNQETYLGALSNGEEIQLLEETSDHYRISNGVYEGYIVKIYGGKPTLTPCSDNNNSTTNDVPATSNTTPKLKNNLKGVPKTKGEPTIVTRFKPDSILPFKPIPPTDTITSDNTSNNEQNTSSYTAKKVEDEFDRIRSRVYGDLSNDQNMDQDADSLKTNEDRYVNAGVESTVYDETVKLAERRILIQRYRFRIECYLGKVECDKTTRGQISASDFEREKRILNDWVNNSSILTPKQRRELRTWLEELGLLNQK